MKIHELIPEKLCLQEKPGFSYNIQVISSYPGDTQVLRTSPENFWDMSSQGLYT